MQLVTCIILSYRRGKKDVLFPLLAHPCPTALKEPNFFGSKGTKTYPWSCAKSFRKNPVLLNRFCCRNLMMLLSKWLNLITYCCRLCFYRVTFSQLALIAEQMLTCWNQVWDWKAYLCPLNKENHSCDRCGSCPNDTNIAELGCWSRAGVHGITTGPRWARHWWSVKMEPGANLWAETLFGGAWGGILMLLLVNSLNKIKVW